jgi:hypothetical protein
MVASISPQGGRYHWCASTSGVSEGRVVAGVVALHLSMSFSGEQSFHVMDLFNRSSSHDGFRLARAGREGHLDRHDW